MHRAHKRFALTSCQYYSYAKMKFLYKYFVGTDLPLKNDLLFFLYKTFCINFTNRYESLNNYIIEVTFSPIGFFLHRNHSP